MTIHQDVLQHVPDLPCDAGHPNVGTGYVLAGMGCGFVA